MNHSAQHEITVSVCVPPELRDQLEYLAEATGRTKSFLAVEALRDYLKTQVWQVEAIQAAVDKANCGKAKFIDHDQVTDWLNSWGTDKDSDISKCR